MSNKWVWLAAGVALGVFVAPMVIAKVKGGGAA